MLNGFKPNPFYMMSRANGAYFKKITQQQGAKPRPNAFLSAIKQGKKPSALNTKSKPKIRPPTPPPEKMSMKDALQARLAQVNINAHGTPTPTPTPNAWGP